MKAMLALILFMLSFAIVSANDDLDEGNPLVTVVWFHMSPCTACNGEAFIYEQLDAMSKSPGEHASWELSSFNTFDASARDRLAKFVEAYDVPPEMSQAPLVIMNGLWLQGFPEIEANFARVYRQASDNRLHPSGLPSFMNAPDHNQEEWTLLPVESPPELRADQEEMKTTTLLGMFGAVLLSGLNPYSLSMFLNFLALLASRSKGMPVPALWFILGIFSVFYLLGFDLVQVSAGITENIMSVFFR